MAGPIRIALILASVVAVPMHLNQAPKGGAIADRGKLRVIVETDAGGDPDDEQSLVRFLLYANEWDVEGIIANRPKARDGENRNAARTGLAVVRRLVEAYGKCRPNLVRHDRRYPKPETLLQRTVSGYADSDDGVRLILSAVDARDPRPVWFMNWGTDHGSDPSSLKRALDRVLSERGPAGYAAFKKRLRISGDDQFGDHTAKIAPPFPLWVDTLRPELDGRRWYHRFSALTATAGGFDLRRDVLSGHGPLGALYPTNTTHVQKEGDSMMFIYLIPTGMNDPEQPTWGSWAGRYGLNEAYGGRRYHWANQADEWEGTTHRENTLKRWAAHLQNDFRARMDWCVASVADANHPPVPRIKGDLRRTAVPGQVITLDARGSSDPDGDRLSFEWVFYPEAGTYRGPLPELKGRTASRVSFRVPDARTKQTLHLIAVVTDDGSPPLTRYARVIVTIVPKTKPALGPLRIHPTNRRYFTDGSRGPGGAPRAVLLTGSHTWDNLVDMDQNDPPRPFDFGRYLDMLQGHGHNFIRLWAWDSTTIDTRANGSIGKSFVHHVAPQPWMRTGPGIALDGEPRFDLSKHNPEYFRRLRTRVQEAGKRGIYVSVMLFEGWGMMHGGHGRPPAPDGWAWRSHPFHKANNVNGIDGDTDGDDRTGEIHSLAVPEANRIQAAYIEKVVETVSDLPNVLYEVINEGGSREWDRWVIETVRACERRHRVRHPIGLTGHGAERLASMLDSTADWVSPGSNDGFGSEPPAWSGDRPSLLDTDHIWGIGGSADWVWKAFMRGHNPLFMDEYLGTVLDSPSRRARWAEIRAAMGHARALADSVDLAAMTPHAELSSSAYCLARPGAKYLVYVPGGGQVTVDLSAARGALKVAWIHPVTGARQAGTPVDGGAKRALAAPFAGPAVLAISASQKAITR